MGFSKDEDGGESPHLTVVGGTHPANDATVPEGTDKATVQKLNELRQEHRELDVEIQALVSGTAFDQLLLTRLKKRKLILRDLITRIEDEILPDIIA